MAVAFGVFRLGGQDLDEERARDPVTSLDIER